MKKAILTLAASIIVMLAACNKENPASSGVSLTPSAMLQSRVALQAQEANPAANPANPYDYIGYCHNIGLDSLRHYQKATNDTTRRGAYAFLSRFFKNNYGADVQLVSNPMEKQISTDYRPVWFSQKLSVQVLTYWQALSDAAQGIKDFDHYRGFKQQVVAIESKVSSDKLEADEKKNLLITASILRYSAYYWMGAFKRGDVAGHFGGGGMDMPDGLIRKIAGVITGICADASVVAAGYMSGDYAIIGSAIWLSTICGYYTGWW